MFSKKSDDCRTCAWHKRFPEHPDIGKHYCISTHPFIKRPFEDFIAFDEGLESALADHKEFPCYRDGSKYQIVLAPNEIVDALRQQVAIDHTINSFNEIEKIVTEEDE